MNKPNIKPKNPCFSSGPCSKRPGWSYENLQHALLGRSHRSKAGKERLKNVIDLQKEILGIPDYYKIAIVPASDTGAIEMALWSMLGERPVEVLVWEHFANEWLTDIESYLKLTPKKHIADYGQLPILENINTDNDVVFVWNGTTSGVRLPHTDWINEDRKGLTFCDATSAVFAYDMPWNKLDVTTWSWQKALGGEAAHGMIALSPRAIERLENYVPPRPLPKIFRMTKGNKLNDALFEGSTINTPSMLVIEDCLDTLNWVKNIGGIEKTQERSQSNLDAVSKWLQDKIGWINFLDPNPETRSKTSITLKITDPWFTQKSVETQKSLIIEICDLLETENAAYDIKHYITAPAGFRIWGGATVETSDIEAVLPWIEWGYKKLKSEHT